MHRRFLHASLALALPLLLVPSAHAPGPVDGTAVPWDALACAGDGPSGWSLHAPVDPANPLLALAVHVICAGEAALDAHHGTDCPSDAYAHQPWRVGRPLDHAYDPFNDDGMTEAQLVEAWTGAHLAWDEQVAADLFGSLVRRGKAEAVGQLDGVNQVGFLRLAGTTVAVHYTWYDAETGLVVETDTGFSLAHPFGVGGEPDRLDVQGMSARFFGIGYGLGSPGGGAENECLTMYPSAVPGDTSKRTLGDGDIEGIRTAYP